jgi:6-phosphogluconolactonase/glucosamine-6-phosphate isomerase/deaminase
VVAVRAAHLHAWRITLAPGALLDARAIMLLVSGDKKAEAVQAALELPTDATRWPVHVLRDADDRVEWLLDKAAAASLSTKWKSGEVEKWKSKL